MGGRRGCDAGGAGRARRGTSRSAPRWTFASLIGDPEGVADNLVDYIAHFSPNVRDVFDGYWLRQSLRRADPCIACAEELSAVATGGSRWPLILMW